MRKYFSSSSNCSTSSPLSCVRLSLPLTGLTGPLLSLCPFAGLWLLLLPHLLPQLVLILCLVPGHQLPELRGIFQGIATCQDTGLASCSPHPKPAPPCMNPSLVVLQ